MRNNYRESEMLLAFKAGQTFENLDCQYAFEEWIKKYKENYKRSETHIHSHDDLQKVAEPLLKFLCENHHPHVTAIVTGTSIELMEGIMTIPKITKFLID